MKVLIKLAIVALLANATWHVWGVWAAHFKFKDAVQSASQFNGSKSESELQSRILELGAQYDVPITEHNFTIRREQNHTIIDGSYVRPVEFLPGFRFPLTFNWHVDTFTMTGAPGERR